MTLATRVLAAMAAAIISLTTALGTFAPMAVAAANAGGTACSYDCVISELGAPAPATIAKDLDTAQDSSHRHPHRATGLRVRPVVDSSAPQTARPAIGFAPGEGVTALTPGRLQHGTAHLTEAGVLPAWSGRNSPQLIRDTLSPILESPTATFDNTLGGTQVKGFIGTVNGQTVAVQVYAEGPLAGQLATSVIPTPNQLTKWSVAP